MKCMCGFQIEGQDEAAMVAATRKHVDDKHADLKLSDNNVEDFVASGLRARPWDGLTRELPPDLEMRRLEPSLREDFLDFFDHDAFADNPAWGACYCMAQHADCDMKGLMSRRASQNRPEIAERIEKGTTTGILAYGNGRPIGWCNAGPRENYPGITRYPGMQFEPEPGVGSIVCFVVAPAYRGQGLGERLLQAALDLLRHQGMRVAEAYPFREAEAPMMKFLGTEKMYAEAGFTPLREAGPNVIMRRDL